MKIKKLIEELQEVVEDFPDADVMMATQPSYPIAERLVAVADPNVSPGDDGSPDPNRTIVWLVSGGQPSDGSPYAPRWVFDAFF